MWIKSTWRNDYLYVWCYFFSFPHFSCINLQRNWWNIVWFFFDLICRKSSQSWTQITANLEDGQAWRKYGQKDILNAQYPRLIIYLKLTLLLFSLINYPIIWFWSVWCCWKSFNVTLEKRKDKEIIFCIFSTIAIAKWKEDSTDMCKVKKKLRPHIPKVKDIVKRTKIIKNLFKNIHILGETKTCGS